MKIAIYWNFSSCPPSWETVEARHRPAAIEAWAERNGVTSLAMFPSRGSVRFHGYMGVGNCITGVAFAV